MSLDATSDTNDGVDVCAVDDATLGERLESMPAGAALAALVFGTDPTELDPYAQVAYMQACQRLLNTLTARQDAGLVAFAGANPRDTVYFVDGNEYAITDARALEVQLALAWSEGHTRSRIAHARILTSRLPECSAVIASGSVQPLVTRAIAEGADTLTASIDAAIACQTHAVPADVEKLRSVRRDLLASFDATLATFAPGRSLKAVGKKVRDTISRLDPAGTLARRAKATRTQSDVRVTPLPDGMAMLTAVMPTEQAHTCIRVIDTHARDQHCHDLTDPIGLRRTHALLDLVTRSAGQGKGLPVHLDVVMTLDAFLGLTDEPGTMPGAGSVPAHALRELITDAAWVRIRRILTDPTTGHALDLGVRRYQLTAAERARIATRDRTCRMIDCQAPAYRCECDHATPYATGGPTQTANLGLLCTRHHQHKTHAGWHITDSQPDGSCTWVSPHGRMYHHEPEPVLPTAPAPPAQAPCNPEKDPPPF